MNVVWFVGLLLCAPEARAATSCNSFIGGVRGLEAQCRGQLSVEAFSTYVHGDPKSWQQSAGAQYGLLDGVEVEAEGTMDTAGGNSRLVHGELTAHWEISHDRPWPTRLGLEWVIYERDIEGGTVRHRSGAAAVVGRYFGALALAGIVEVEFPDPEADFGVSVRYPVGDFMLACAIVDEPEDDLHQVVVWPEVGVELGRSVGLVLTAGIGLSPAAPDWAVRGGVDIVLR